MDPRKVLIHGAAFDFEYVREGVLEARGLEWRASKPLVSAVDHHHCIVCWWTLHASGNAETSEAYEGQGHWLCTECYTRFVESNELGV